MSEDDDVMAFIFKVLGFVLSFALITNAWFYFLSVECSWAPRAAWSFIGMIYGVACLLYLNRKNFGV